jgi:hypothetical protein
MRRLAITFLLAAAVLSPQACVGKFLSNMLSTENAQFKLLEVVPVSNTKILVGFNKPLDYTKGALTLSNYSIPGLNLVSVEKGNETNQVFLRLDPADSVRMQRQYYTLSVSGVQNIYWDDLLPGDENRSKQFLGARWVRATCLDDAGSFTCPPDISAATSTVTYNVTVRGDYAKGSNYRWSLKILGSPIECKNPKNTNLPDCNNNAAPPLDNATGNGAKENWIFACRNPKNTNAPTCNDNGSPLLDNSQADGAFTLSPIDSVNNPFSIPAGISTGSYLMEMMIQDADGAWQPATDLSQHKFSVDNTSLTNIALSNVPAALTSSTVTAINVVYRNCVAGGFPNGFAAPCSSPSTPVATEIPTYYKYRIGTKAGTVSTDCNGAGYTFGAWSASRTTNLPIVEVLSTSQCYNFQVVAADNVNNYQCDTTQADGTPGACANPAGPGTGSITDFFATKTWQETRFLLDTTAPTAAFDTNTLPPTTTSATSFAVVVDATGLDKYRYRVIGTGFSGTWSTDKTPGAAGELITGAGLTNGNYSIELIGKDAAGNYQSTSSATTFAFTVDTSAPTAAVVSHANCSGATGLPPNPTNRNCVDIQVNSVTFYKYKWVTGSTCGTGGYGVQMTAASNFITSGPAWTDGATYSLCVIGSNNGTLYQGEAETAVTRYSFRYDTTPPVSQIGTWVNPAADLTGKSTVLDSLSVSINKFTRTQTGTTTSGSAVVTGLSSTTGMVAGMIVSATSGIAAGATVLSVDSATQITMSANATATGARSLTIASEEIQNYKGIITTAACPTSATMVGDNSTYPITSPQSPLQATAIGTGTVHICFIGRDAAGNWEGTTHDVSYTRFSPPAPGDGGGANDAQYTNSFNFTWTTGPTGIPTGTQKISIRVCKDSACTNSLPGMNNGKDVCTSVGTCDVTSSFTLDTTCTGLDCIKQVNGSTYFAQLKVTDSIGQESIFGTVSNGKVVTGQVTGTVRNSFNAAISGATVGIYQSDCSTQVGGNVASAPDGSFTFSLGGGHSLPILLTANGYCIKVTSGALQGTKKFIESKPGTATNAGTIYAVDTSGTPGCLIGAIVDGSTGSQLILSNATFTLKDFNNNTVASTPALDPDGKQFVFPSACLNTWGAAPYNSPTYTYASGLTPGVYTLDVSIPGYYSISETVAITTAATANAGFMPMVGTFTAGSKQIKVILTWGNTTKDLDIHMVGPSSGIDCQPYNEAAIQNAAGSKFHVSYQQRYCAETGTSAPYGSTSLAVDDSYEYGPEIINFYDGYADGTYKLSVYNNDLPRRVGNMTSGSAVITGLPSTSDLAVGMSVRALAGIPVSTTIASIDSSTQVTLSANATATSAQVLDFTRDWNVSKARIDVYAGSHFAGGGGLIKTVLSSGSSAQRGWKALRLVVSGTTLTVDDTTSTGYADWYYGPTWTKAATRTNASPNLTGLASTADLIVGMKVSGRGIAANTTIASILSATSVQMSANATSNGGADSYGFTFNACTGGLFINGPSDGLTAGAAPAAGTNPADPNLDCGLFLNGTTVAGGAGPLDW